jgi:hypothetical protein
MSSVQHMYSSVLKTASSSWAQVAALLQAVVQHPLQASMGCKSSRNVAAPATAEAAHAATEVSANAPAASPESTVPDSAVAHDATVRDQTPSAVPPSPSLIEGLLRYTPNDKQVHLCVSAEPLLMFLSMQSNRSERYSYSGKRFTARRWTYRSSCTEFCCAGSESCSRGCWTFGSASR